MSTRSRAAYLRKLGFKKSPMALTRGTTMYRHPDKPRLGVTIVKGVKEDGGGFIIVGGPVTFQSGLLGIGNTKDGMKLMIQNLHDQLGLGQDGNYVIPDPQRADYLSPEYIEELFRGMVVVNLYYEAAEAA